MEGGKSRYLWEGGGNFKNEKTVYLPTFDIVSHYNT
jgi:hypothetical protein